LIALPADYYFFILCPILFLFQTALFRDTVDLNGDGLISREDFEMVIQLLKGLRIK